jgi:nucleotide-binding universal stress UspA family protein
MRYVVGVDGSEGGAEALRWARREATLHDAGLTAVLAWGLLDQHHPDPDAEFDVDYAEPQARAALEAFLEAALGADAKDVERVVVKEGAAQALLDASTGADLLVVGARGLGGFRGMLLGSVSQHCLHHATVPVAVVRPGAATGRDQERVVVGIDGSEPSLTALRWALDEGRRRPATVTVVHSWRMPYVGGSPWVVNVYDTDEWEKAAVDVLAGALEAEDTSGVRIEQEVVHGSAPLSLLEASRTADLVVVGSRGRGGFAGLLLGSTSLHVARHATCPVVVIPPGASS